MPGCLQSSRSSAHPCRVTPTGKADGIFLSTLLSAILPHQVRREPCSHRKNAREATEPMQEQEKVKGYFTSAIKGGPYCLPPASLLWQSGLLSGLIVEHRL